MDESLPTNRSRAVVILHGLYGSSLELDAFATVLRQHGFHVVTPRLSGYSAAENDAAVNNAQPDCFGWIAQAATEIDHLATTYAEVNLCGVSTGATLALAVAAAHPTKIDALSLISTTLILDGWNVSRWRYLLPLAYFMPVRRLYRHRERPPYGVKNERMRAWLAEELQFKHLSYGGASCIPAKSLREADRLIRHVAASLGHIRTPTLLIHAREDDVASLANVRFVRKHIGADMVREIIVENSYHMITLDNDCAYAADRTAHFFDAMARRRTQKALAISRWVEGPRYVERKQSS
jgi:carboxylesterase